MTAFTGQLAFGKVAEGKIAKWLMRRGHSILPVYEQEKHTGKGPQLFAADHSFVAPDMLVFGNKFFWGEAKHKTVFTWHRKTSRWTTGIDAHHYKDYRMVRECHGLPLWIFFLHESDVPDGRDLKHGCPDRCPVGLFGEEIETLAEKENHRHENWGRHGMVYWAHESLMELAPLSDFT